MAFWIRVLTAIVAIGLAAPATALLLGQVNAMRADYVPQRHVPGADGSISIQSADSYVLVRHAAELPECVVTSSDGYELLLDTWQFGDHPAGKSFYAEAGRYDVTCEGGQDGVVALQQDEYERSLGGPWRLNNPAWPMFAGALLVFFLGRVVASRLTAP